MPSFFALAGAALFGCAAVLPRGLSAWAVIGLSGLAGAALVARSVHAFRLVLFCLLIEATRWLLPSPLRVWPLPTLLPLVAFEAAALFAPPLRNAVPWSGGREFCRRHILHSVALAFVSLVALLSWVGAKEPDFTRYTGGLPSMPVWALPFAGLGFALLNAAMEEISFRGIIFDALRGVLGTEPAPLWVQAFLFGALHYRTGFPDGPAGVAMTFAFGVALGVLRLRSGGLALPCAVHAFADGVIFAIVARFVLSLPSAA
jgi:membrane protease YdiL (CAAX protease family)